MICKTFLLTTILISVSFSANNAFGIVDLSPQLSTVSNQGTHRNTCSAFAATSLMEFLIKQETGKSVDLSEQWAYWAAKNKSLNTPYLKDLYGTVDGHAGFLGVQAYQYGAMLETEWTYEEESWFSAKDARCKMIDGVPQTDCFTGIPPANAKVLKKKLEPIFVDRHDIAQFIVDSKKPVVFNIEWYSGISDNAGNIRMPDAFQKIGCILHPDTCSSGHVILLTGYDADKKLFLFRNSWGPDWGTNGYGTIPEQYIVENCEVCRYLDKLGDYDQETQDFVTKASQGVTGRLVH